MRNRVCLQFLPSPLSVFLCTKHLMFWFVWMPDLKSILSMPSNHSFNNLQDLCRYDVKVVVELRNKLSAVFYRIFYGTRHFAAGFVFEMHCPMHVMLLNAFWPCFSVWKLFWICFARSLQCSFLLNACSDSSSFFLPCCLMCLFAYRQTTFLWQE